MTSITGEIRQTARVMQTIINHLQAVSAPFVYLIVGALVFAEAALLVGFVLPAEIAVTTGGFLANHNGAHPHGSVNLGVLGLAKDILLHPGNADKTDKALKPAKKKAGTVTPKKPAAKKD